MKNTVHISVVSPVYRAEKILSTLVDQVTGHLSAITEEFEIILVNDDSPDHSWDEIIRLCKTDHRVKAINLSRNFGQHYAITAGLRYATGEWVVVMDCDLQDRPDEIRNLYNKANEGYDIVYARRIERKDNFLKRLSSKIFHVLFTYLSGLKSDSTIANFGIFSTSVIREYNTMKEQARSFGSLVNYLGFKKTVIDVKHNDRFEGETSYSFQKLLKLASDVILSNSNKPLKLTVKSGFLISLLSFLLALYNIIAYFTGIIKVPGFTTTIFSIWFVGGLLLFVLGIVGLYIGMIFDQVKGRQLFIVKDLVNLQE
ncbi:MAG: glycosyltransferase family 2 protein [Bacteroidetes bacterium]|nr:glycosyltransferase family 2 protein [Bacteroidota bacterium]